MVNVPVYDQHSIYIVLLLGIFGCYGYIVEEAESTGLVDPSMMTWWPHKGNPIGGLSGRQLKICVNTLGT